MYKISEKKIAMALQKLLSSGLIFIALTAVTAVNYYDMPQFVEPNYYGIKLTLYIQKDHYINAELYNKHEQYISNQLAKNNSIFYAEFHIIFQVTRETQKIYLHAYNLDICTTTSMQLFDLHNVKLPQEIKWWTCWNDVEEQIVTFYFNDKIKPGIYNLRMKYVGAITDHTGGGIFKTSYIDENGDRTWLFAAGNFLPHEIRQVFPCWDKPSIESIIHFIFIGSYENYTVLSGLPTLTSLPDLSVLTLPLKQIENDMAQSYSTSKSVSDPFVTSIYRVAFVVSRLYNASESVNMWCRKRIAHHTKFAQNIAKNVTMYLKWRYVPNITHVAIPGFRNEGTDSWNLILYSEAAVTYDKHSDPIAHKIEVARLIGYKIVHYMLDCDRIMSSWSDLWIIEGVAIFFGAYVIDKIIPDTRMMDLFVVQAKHEALRWDTYYDITLEIQDDTLSKMESIWFYPRYLKASLLMLMMQHVITDNVFFEGVHRLHSNIEHYDFNHFWYNMQAVVHGFNHHKVVINNSTFDFNVTQTLSGWTKQRHYPVLNVRRDYITNDVTIELSLLNNFNLLYQNNCWIPVTYITQTSPIFNHDNTYWLNSQQPKLHLNFSDDGWIIINAQQAGYYRVRYDNINWGKIISYLYTDSYINIHVLNRAQIVDDVYYFVSINYLHYSLFQQVTHYLRKETDYIVWYAMFKNMEHMSSFFVFSESTELKKYLREILDGLMINIGYDEVPNDNYYTKCLRQEAAKWACILDSQICKGMANKMRWHLTKREACNLSPWWKEWIYCASISSTEVDSIVWTQMLSEYESLLEYDNKILEHLTCTTDPDNVKNYLRILQTKFVRIYTIIPNYLKIFLSIVAKHANNDEVLEFILSSFKKVKPSEINEIAVVIGIINHVYDKSKLQQINDFVRNNLIQLFPHVQRKTEQRLLQINTQINFWKFLNFS